MHFSQYLKEMEANQEKLAQKEELQCGVKHEREHSATWKFFQDWADLNDLELPISEEEFYKSIAEVHINEFQNYYDELEKMENKLKNTNKEENN